MIEKRPPSASRRRGNSHLERGAAAVEMALVMPLLILMVMGIIDFGRIFNGEIQLSQAAREGARVSALGFSSTDVTTRTRAALNNPAFQGGVATISVDVVAADGGAISGGAGRVCAAGDSTANYGQVTVYIPYNKILFGPSSLSQKAVMKCSG